MKYITAILLTILLGAGTFTAYAASNEARMDKRIARMTERLDLNEQQQQQMREIIKTHKAEKKALHKAKTSNIKAILTPEQVEKFEKHRAERKANRKERKQRHKQCDREYRKQAS